MNFILNYKRIIKKDPLDIIVKLEDRFNDSYDKIREKIYNNMEENEDSDFHIVFDIEFNDEFDSEFNDEFDND